LSFFSDRIEIRGVTVGGAVALHGVLIHSLHYLLEVVPISVVLEDAGGTGSVVFTRAGGIPWHSVWSAVDVVSGEYTLDVPPGAPRRIGEFICEGAWAGATEVRWRGQRYPFPPYVRQLNFLLVRPGVGAWRIYSRDGSSQDADRAIDGRQTIALGDLWPLWGQVVPPTVLKGGDVLVGVEGTEVSITALRTEGRKGPWRFLRRGHAQFP